MFRMHVRNDAGQHLIAFPKTQSLTSIFHPTPYKNQSVLYPLNAKPMKQQCCFINSCSIKVAPSNPKPALISSAFFLIAHWTACSGLTPSIRLFSITLDISKTTRHISGYSSIHFRIFSISIGLGNGLYTRVSKSTNSYALAFLIFLNILATFFFS